jgi:hypothetical protein
MPIREQRLLDAAYCAKKKSASKALALASIHGSG